MNHDTKYFRQKQLKEIVGVVFHVYKDKYETSIVQMNIFNCWLHFQLRHIFFVRRNVRPKPFINHLLTYNNINVTSENIVSFSPSQ